MLALIFLLGVWLVLCFLVAIWAEQRGRDRAIAFICSILFSPLLMWLVYLAIGTKPDPSSYSPAPWSQPERTKRCPACAELILAEARKCKHCGEWLKDEPPAPIERFNNPLRIEDSER